MSPREISRLLLNTAYALFALFAATTLIDAMPPALLDSGWIVTTAASLVNVITLPLVGLIFIHLAAYFTPTPQLQSIQARYSRLAAMAALGFLLLAPLLGVLVIHNSQTIARTNTKVRLQLTEQSKQLKRAVIQSRTPAELQAAMVALKGPTLDSAALAQPLPGLKTDMLRVIETLKARYLSQLKGAYSPQSWPILKVVLRTSIQCILVSLAFAALAWSPLTHKSLLARLREQPSRGGHQRQSIGTKAWGLPAGLQAWLKSVARMNERRALAEKTKRKRAQVMRRIAQKSQEREPQTRPLQMNAEKQRQHLGRELNRDRSGSDFGRHT